MLITGHEIRVTQAHQEGDFQDYIREHHASWLEFANGRLGRRVRPQDLALVFGCCMTVDFALLTFSNVVGEAQVALGAGLPGIASGDAAGTKRHDQTVSPAVNVGPSKQSSADVSVTEGIPALKDPSANFKQCVFLKRYRIQNKWWRPKSLTSRGMAGPHDLGPEIRVGGDEMDVEEDGGDVSSGDMENGSAAVRKHDYWATEDTLLNPRDRLQTLQIRYLSIS